MELTSPQGQTLFDLLPERIYGRSVTMADVYEAIGAEIDLLFEAADEMLVNSFLATVDWALPNWEYELGLPINPLAIADDDRRSRLQATGRLPTTIMTRSEIMRIIALWNFGSVSIYEDIPNYTVIYTFNGAALPSDINRIYIFLRELTPAGLAMSTDFSFMTWDDLEAEGLTWDDVEALTPPSPMDWDHFEIYFIA